MPTKCDECFYLNECKAFDKLSTAEQGFLVFALKRRAKDCPLVEIPPHGRLIDADVFEEMLNSKGGIKLKDVPTVIESEEE